MCLEAAVVARGRHHRRSSTGNSRAIAAALAETESSVREPLLLPVRSCTSTGWLRVRSRSRQPLATTSVYYRTRLGHHLPAGYQRFVVGAPGLMLSADVGRCRASSARDSGLGAAGDRSVLTACFVFWSSLHLWTGLRTPGAGFCGRFCGFKQRVVINGYQRRSRRLCRCSARRRVCGLAAR